MISHALGLDMILIQQVVCFLSLNLIYEYIYLISYIYLYMYISLLLKNNLHHDIK